MKNWIVHYFRGCFLAHSFLMKKQDAITFMENHVDGHSMEKVTGFGKGKIIYKFPNKETVNGK